MSQPPPIPGDLVEKLSMKSSEYELGWPLTDLRELLRRGRTSSRQSWRDEYRWVPVEVRRSTAVADVTPRGSRTTCDVARGL